MTDKPRRKTTLPDEVAERHAIERRLWKALKLAPGEKMSDLVMIAVAAFHRDVGQRRAQAECDHDVRGFLRPLSGEELERAITERRQKLALKQEVLAGTAATQRVGETGADLRGPLGRRVE